MVIVLGDHLNLLLCLATFGLILIPAIVEKLFSCRIQTVLYVVGVFYAIGPLIGDCYKLYFNMRSQRGSIFTLGNQNKTLWFAGIGSIIATTLVCEVPFLANAFGFASVGIGEYLIAIALGLVVVPVVELVKLIQRKVGKNS